MLFSVAAEIIKMYFFLSQHKKAQRLLVSFTFFLLYHPVGKQKTKHYTTIYQTFTKLIIHIIIAFTV